MSDEVVYHHAPKTEEYGETPTPAAVKVEPEAVEQSDRGMFSFLGKKEEENKCDDEVVYPHAPKTEEYGETPIPTTVTVEPEAEEQSDRGMLSFLGKKEEENKCDDAVTSSEFEEKVQVSEPEPEPKSEEKKESLLDKLHRSDSKSSSSSDEEGEDGEKKKKKKSLKDKIKEKFDKKEEEKVEDDTRVPIEKYEEVAVPTPTVEEVYPIMDHGPPHIAPEPELEPEEKKGFMEKIKKKLPGGHKKVEDEHVAPSPTPVVAATPEVEGEHKEKKGIFEKIKEKIPGYHPKNEDEKEKEKECD